MDWSDLFNVLFSPRLRDRKLSSRRGVLAKLLSPKTWRRGVLIINDEFISDRRGVPSIVVEFIFVCLRHCRWFKGGKSNLY